MYVRLQVFLARLDEFPWPKGVEAVKMDYNPDRKLSQRWGSEVSMTMYRLLGTAVLFSLDGVVSSVLQTHFSQFFL